MARFPTLFNPAGLMSAGGSDSFLALHREMNRLFDDVLRSSGVPSGTPSTPREGMLMAPHVDVTETDTEVQIHAELPGVNQSDIDVTLNDDVLTIRAEKRQVQTTERSGMHFSERSFGTFQRSLRLPFQIEPDQVQAHFENGVLRVNLRKTAHQARSHRIPLRTTQPASQVGQERPASESQQAEGGAPQS